MNILLYGMESNGVEHHRLIVPHAELNEKYDDIFAGRLDAKNADYDEIIKELKNWNVFVFSRIIPVQLLQRIKKETKCIVIDDVDDFWQLPDWHPISLNYKQLGITDKIKRCMELADYVTTTNYYLAEKIKNFNKNVKIFPNGVKKVEEISTLGVKIWGRKNPSKRIRFGIVGSASHTKDMELFSELGNQMTNFLKENAQIVLAGFDEGSLTIWKMNGEKETRYIPPKDTIWGEWEKNLTNNYKNISDGYKERLMKFEKIDWNVDECYRRMWTKSVSSYIKIYEDIDCLLVPLIDSEFNRCKSPLKLAECEATRTGVLCSDVLPYSPYLNNFQKVNIRKRGRGFIEAMERYVKAEDKSIYVPHNEEFNLEKITEDRYKWLKTLY